MIRILVVDDNAVKIQRMREVLVSLEIPDDHVTYVNSAIDAKRVLTKEMYDVMLLDLVLPLRKDMPPEHNVGMELLREINELDHYKLPDRVFVISEFDDAIRGLDNIANELFYAVIKYQSSGDEWISRLRNYLEQILRTEMEHNESYNFDVGILCALETPELDEVKKLPFNWVPYNILGDSTDYFTGSFKDKKIVCASSYEMGLSSAAVLATKIISSFHPHYLIMTGMAGGVDANVLHFGDVLIADPCFDYESGKKVYIDGQSIFKPDYRQIRLDDTVNQVLRRLSGRVDELEAIKNACTLDKPVEPLQIKIGPFGSGASVLSDSTVIARVKEHNRKFLGFDMEAYAVMLAGMLSVHPKTIPVVIKSVSDFGDGKTDKYQQYAAYTSSRIMMLFLKELFDN